MVSLAARRAAAQATPPQPQTGFQDGFFIQSADGNNRLAIGMLIQVDGRFAVDDPLPITNTFSVRKVRPNFTGRVGRYFDFKVTPDFGNGTSTLADAYFDIRFARAFRLRTGKDKTPLGHELLQGDANVLFPERSLASGLVPNRDVGVQAQGDLWGGRLAYSGGLFNGIPDGTSSSADVDTNSDKDLAGRVNVQPFRVATGPQPALAGLGFHFGVSHGTQNGTLPSFKTSIGQTFYTYATGTVAAGTRNRITPAAFYYYKSLGMFGEYVRSAQTVTRGLSSADVANHGWEVTGSYVLTGEAASVAGVRPRNNFDPATGHWGALQVLARYAVLTVDAAAFSNGFAAATASREARQWTVGLNWYPNPWIKWYATFEHVAFDGGAAVRPGEDSVFFRGQLAF
jgi:phosphate-selective porin OprO/OprP